MKRKALSFLLVLCMLIGMLPAVSLPVYAIGSTGPFTVTGGTLDTDYSYAANVLTILSSTAISIANTSSEAVTTDRIVVQSGVTANITLNGVNIDLPLLSSACAFDATGATVNVTLAGTNTLKSGWDHAGLQVPNGAVLTIDGSGSLRATGGSNGAGIGGGRDKDGGTIIINGGTVTATGALRSAGIGGGNPASDMGGGNGGTITINGGTVTATGSYGAGIGGGHQGAGGTITISGGTVTATGGNSAAGIGSGYQEAGGTIAISGGTVTATGGDNGAGIGGGNQSTGGTINISGSAIVTAEGGSYAPGIGTGWSGTSYSITIGPTANIKAFGQNIEPAIQSVSACSAYILMATFTADKSSGTKSEIRTSTDTVLSSVIEWAPASTYQSIAFTLPSDIASYTIYAGGVKQQYTNGATTSSAFGIAGAGLTAFHAVTALQAAPAAAVQSISGTIRVGQTLTGQYTYSDVNSDAEGTSTYKWYRSDDSFGASKAAIASATSITYVLQAADLAKYISFEVTPIASSGALTGDAVESDMLGAITAADEGGSGGGSGGGGSTATTVINTNTGSVTGNQLSNAAGAAKDGETITINSNQNNGVTFPASGLSLFSEKNNSLTVVTGNGTLTFDSKAVSSMGKQAAESDIEVFVEKVKKETLTDEQQAIVGNKSVYDLTVMSDKKLISNFNDGRVTVIIPYELKTGETADNLTVWYLADDGSMTEITCAYDASAKTVTFVVDHFSQYVIGYDYMTDWVNPFTDIKNSDWYYDAVGFVNAYDLMNGQTSTKFGAEAAMTRAMFVTILGRMEGVDVAMYTNQNTFSDVNNNQYYASYTAWASDKGIVSGMGEGKFAPDAEITREQMAVMMTNYMKYKGQGPVGSWAIQLTYSDLDQISPWAAEGVMFMTMKSIMNGTGKDANGNSVFSSLSTSNRAQAATMLKRLSESN